jgi:hypothetical protein
MIILRNLRVFILLFLILVIGQSLNFLYRKLMDLKHILVNLFFCLVLYLLSLADSDYMSYEYSWMASDEIYSTLFPVRVRAKSSRVNRLFKSKHSKSKYDPLHPRFVTGFTDAEGCFSIGIFVD